MRSLAWALGVALVVAGCEAAPAKPVADVASGDVAGVDVAPDADPTKSWYRLSITTEVGQTYAFERDLTDKPGAFSFGSTHIAPAVSFAVSEDLTFPAVVNITFNLGIVVGSNDFPVQTYEAREYPFSTAPPEVDVTLGLRYRSTVPGASGSVVLTSWSPTTGGVMAGTFQGRLLQQTDGPSKRWADVEGAFHFIVPEAAQGQ